MNNSNVYKWSLIERVAVAAITFGGNIALTRLLTTADFGLLAMIAIFTAVAYDISGAGLSDGLIHKLHPTRTDYSTVFIFNSTLGFLFGLTFILIAPMVARFFGHQELVVIMRILGVCFFIQTLGFVQETKMRKELAVKQLCICRVGAALSALILGLVLALTGKGYWALVSTQIFVAVFTFIYYIIATRWWPGLKFSVTSFKEFFNYGIHLVLAYISSIIGRNINTFILGRFYSSPSASGVYYQGAKLANVPFSITESSINAPFFVVASNEKDPDIQKNLITDMFSVICGVNGIIMLFIILVANPAINLLYGAKWVAAIPILRILAIFEFLACIKYFFQTVCKVAGRTSIIRNLTVTEVIVQLTLLAIFFRYGILWIAWTQVGGVFFTVCAYSFIYRRFLRINTWEYIRMFIAPLAIPLIAFAVCGAVTGHWVESINPFAGCLIIAVIYFSLCIGAFEITRPKAYLAIRKKLLRQN